MLEFNIAKKTSIGISVGSKSNPYKRLSSKASAVLRWKANLSLIPGTHRKLAAFLSGSVYQSSDVLTIFRQESLGRELSAPFALVQPGHSQKWQLVSEPILGQKVSWPKWETDHRLRILTLQVVPSKLYILEHPYFQFVFSLVVGKQDVFLG